MHYDSRLDDIERRLTVVETYQRNSAEPLNDTVEYQRETMQRLERNYGHIVHILERQSATLANHDEQLASLNSDVCILKADVDAMKTNVSTLEKRVEQGFTGVKADIATLNSDITGIKTDIAVLNNDITDIKAMLVKHLK